MSFASKSVLSPIPEDATVKKENGRNVFKNPSVRLLPTRAFSSLSFQPHFKVFHPRGRRRGVHRRSCLHEFLCIRTALFF